MKCSFCGKSEDEVQRLIAADNNVAICDECVIECLNMLVYGEPESLIIDLGDDEKENKNSGD